MKKNRSLWKDEVYFNLFSSLEDYFAKLLLSDNKTAYIYRDIGNILDNMMQDYEKLYGVLEDPYFYYYFAFSNALYLSLTKENDRLDNMRGKWVINGFKEGLRRNETIK